MISVAASVADEVSLTGRIGYQHYPECRIICTYPYTLKQGVWVVVALVYRTYAKLLLST